MTIVCNILSIPISYIASQIRSAYAIGINRILDTVLMMLVDFETILRDNSSWLDWDMAPNTEVVVNGDMACLLCVSTKSLSYFLKCKDVRVPGVSMANTTLWDKSVLFLVHLLGNSAVTDLRARTNVFDITWGCLLTLMAFTFYCSLISFSRLCFLNLFCLTHIGKFLNFQIEIRFRTKTRFVAGKKCLLGILLHSLFILFLTQKELETTEAVLHYSVASFSKIFLILIVCADPIILSLLWFKRFEQLHSALSHPSPKLNTAFRREIIPFVRYLNSLP